MNREEAIKYGTDWLKDEYLDARDGAFIEIALEALEQMPVTTTAGEGGVIYYPQVEGVTPTVVDAGKQEPKILETLDFAINASDGDTTYFVGFRNGLRYSKSLIDGEEPQFENCTEQEPCEDAIDRKLVCAFIDGLISDDGEREKGLEYIRNMPPVETHDKRTETHACDYIHRQDVLDLAKKGVLISNGNYESVCKAINELPPVNPQPCEDAISRQAVCKIIDDIRDCVSVNGYWAILERLKKLPSVNPTKNIVNNGTMNITL